MFGGDPITLGALDLGLCDEHVLSTLVTHCVEAGWQQHGVDVRSVALSAAGEITACAACDGTRVGVVGGGVEGANRAIRAEHGVEGSTAMGRLQGGSGGLHGHCGTN